MILVANLLRISFSATKNISLNTIFCLCENENVYINAKCKLSKNKNRYIYRYIHIYNKIKIFAI